jgi:hypothetical protein
MQSSKEIRFKELFSFFNAGLLRGANQRMTRIVDERINSSGSIQHGLLAAV